MEIENKIETEVFLNRCLNKKVKEIYITGWTEIKNGINFFHPFLKYYYIEFEDFYICIERDDLKYGFRFYVHKKIQCNFEDIFKDREIFTIARVNETDYEGQKVVSYDLFYSKIDGYVWALGIQFEDTRYMHPNHKHAFFDGVSSFDGIIFGDQTLKNTYLEDDRFLLVKYPSKNNLD